jgi:hypothetical protein
MHSFLRGSMAFAVATLIGVSPLFAQTSTPHTSTTQSTTPTLPSDAIREHVDEAEDLVGSLLDWQHVVTWSDRGKLHAPPPEGPSNTLISIEQKHVKELTALLEAVASQLPAPAVTTQAVRGDLRAHLNKAREIARELQPPHAAPTAQAVSAPSGLVTIDRTTLQRLDVELDAMRMLLPRQLSDTDDSR